MTGKIAEVGDQVLITSADECIYGCNSDMRKLVGKCATIISCRWIYGRDAYSYSLDIDDGMFMWCGNCLEPIKDITESDADICVLLGGMGNIEQ